MIESGELDTWDYQWDLPEMHIEDSPACPRLV